MLKAGAIGAIAGVAGAAIALVVGDAVSGPLLTASSGGATEEVVLMEALFITAFGGGVAVGLAALAKRFLARPAAAFLAICVVGLIAFGGVAFMMADDLATGVWLNVAHIAAAIPMVGMLANVLPESSEERNSLVVTA